MAVNKRRGLEGRRNCLPLDNHSLSNLETQWLSTLVRGIELRAIRLESSSVVDVDGVALLSLARALNVAGNVDNKAGLLRGRGGNNGGSRGQDSKRDELHCDVCVVCL